MNILANTKRFTSCKSLLRSSKHSFSSMTEYDLVVIGAGPGGYVAAIKASQLGMKTVCIDKRESLGGTCLNIGCIPSKTLLNSSHLYHTAKYGLSKFGISVKECEIDIGKMQAEKNNIVKSLTGGISMLFRKNKVDWLSGKAKLKSKNQIEVISRNGDSKTISGKSIIIATGSDSKKLPGIDIDEKDILTSTGALELKEVPKRLVVIGAGVIGLEMGSVWNRLGSKVTVVEYFDKMMPNMDNEIANEFTKILKKQGFDFKFSTAVKSAVKKSGGIELTLENQKDKSTSFIECDKVLVAVGRQAYFDELGVKELGITIENGLIKTDQDLMTNIPHIFAIGDVTKGAQLAHKAEEEGIAVVEKLKGIPVHLNYDAIPSVIYTSPEVASVGKTEEQLKKDQIGYKKGLFPFLANSRAKAVNDYEGFVKVLAHKESGKVLGVHIIGEQAGDLVQEACLAINYGGSAEDIARTCHAHPTRSEALKEAALAAFEKPIHI